MTAEEILDEIVCVCEEVLKADGFDNCVIGLCESANGQTVIAYDKQKMIKTMVDRDGITYEEAEEYYDYNILGSYMGSSTPVYIELFNEGDFDT